MLNEYFVASNPVMSSKMVGEIVLTSEEHSVNRVKRYYDFISEKLDKECKDTDILPYITNFSQVLSTLQRNSELSVSKNIETCQIS